MPAVIRKIQPSDVETIRELHYSHLSPAAKSKYFKINPQSAARTEKMLAGLEGVCLVAGADSKTVAYLIGSLINKPLTTIQYATLENILVLPAYRRQGIGSALMHSFTAWAETAGATRLSVDVSPRNQEAITFYEHHGLAAATLTLEGLID
jgi:ribosomal protein S18 acetylase RimI-like enzyme